MARKVGVKRLRMAITAHYGNVMKICEDLNISRAAFYNYRNEYDLKDEIKAARDSIVDIAESQLIRHVKEVNEGLGDLQAIKFVLSTWGKDRGWTTRTEITGADGASLFGQPLPDDVLAFLDKEGIGAEAVESMAVTQFVEIIRSVMVEDGTSPTPL